VSSIDDVVSANREFAERFDQGDAPRVPRKALVVLTCFDARVHAERFLGLGFGDAHVLRNAGGRATDDALRSLIISSKLLGTRACMVIHHTGCGMLTITNEDVRSMLEADTGTSADHIDFLPIADLEESAREDARTIRANPFLPPGFEVTSWIYDVRTGLIRSVDDT
jgi:carbonic anhydrase